MESSFDIHSTLRSETDTDQLSTINLQASRFKVVVAPSFKPLNDLGGIYCLVELWRGSNASMVHSRVNC